MPWELKEEGIFENGSWSKFSGGSSLILQHSNEVWIAALRRLTGCFSDYTFQNSVSIQSNTHIPFVALRIPARIAAMSDSHSLSTGRLGGPTTLLQSQS